MKMVMATKNAHKIVEMRALLEGLDMEVLSEADVDLDIEVEETGETCEENSLIKAKSVMECTGLPAVADDSGLCVTALGGGPGVYSARYGGEGLTDKGRYELVLQNLKGQLDRSAKFVSVITACFPNGKVITARGECPGLITYTPRGDGDFGYDPIFLVPEKRKTFAEMTGEEKNAISHRGRAMAKFREELGEYLKEL